MQANTDNDPGQVAANAEEGLDQAAGQTQSVGDPAISAEFAAPDNPPIPGAGNSAGTGASSAVDGSSPDGGDRELETLRDRHLRLAAEYDNFRKRTERERMEGANRAQGELVGRLLDALDDLGRFAHQDPSKVSSASLLDAAQAVERKLMRTLEMAGLERIEAEGQPFDPAQHEAITTMAAESRDLDGRVADVFQAGYRFRGSLIRPARVRVHRYG